MLSVLLRLDGPLQSWGATSMFERRATEPWPTKSGVIGLAAAALGLDRRADLRALAALEFAVRVDQGGRVVSDFHTAGQSGWVNAEGKVTVGAPKLSTRKYVADAVFVAALAGDDTLIEAVAAALQQPVYHLFLGRRSCPPAAPILIGVTGDDPITALGTVAYQGRRAAPARLLVACSGHGGIVVADEPASFAPLDRRYGPRAVVTRWMELPGAPHPDGTGPATLPDDDPYLLQEPR